MFREWYTNRVLSKQEAFTLHDGRLYVAVDALVDAAAYPIIMAPFYGGFIPCTVRELTHAQLDNCGKFSLIELMTDKLASRKKPTKDQIYDYAKLQHAICKKSMVTPSYEQMFEWAGSKIDIPAMEKEIDDLYQLTREMKEGPERDGIIDEIEELQLASKFILPSEFTSYIVSYAAGVDKSDIKEITDDMLADAAIMAINGHNDPSKHISGNFTDHNRHDIDNRAWIEYAKRNKHNGKRR